METSPFVQFGHADPLCLQLAHTPLNFPIHISVKISFECQNSICFYSFLGQLAPDMNHPLSEKVAPAIFLKFFPYHL